MKFCEILREILNDYELNQTELSKKLNIKPSQISEWLKEKANPGYDTLRNFAIVLNLSGDYLLGLEDEIGANSRPLEVTGFSPDEIKFVTDLRKLTPGMRDILRTTLNAMINDSKVEV